MLKITFEFDEKSEKIMNLSVKKIMKNLMKTNKSDTSQLKVDTNKIVLSSNAVELLNASAGDRISINYFQVDKETTFPIIAKAELFSDKLAGNKLTKSGTVSFKGQQRETLLQYGEVFIFEPYQEGVYKLVSPINTDNSESLETEEQELEELTDAIIDEEDDLPF